MSLTVIAELVLGFAVPYQAMKRPPRRVCLHPETSSRFCGECGKPMWNQDGGVRDFQSSHDLEVFRDNTPNFHRIDEDRPMIIGRKLRTQGPLPLDFLPDREGLFELEEVLRAEISAAGIPVETEALVLGLHLVRYIS